MRNCGICGKSWGHHCKDGKPGFLGACESYQEPKTKHEWLEAARDDAHGETRDEEYLVCPLCGYPHGNMHEWASGVAMKGAEYTCEDCGGVFLADRRIAITYVGRPIK